MSDTNRVRLSYAKTSQRGGAGVAPVAVDVTLFSPASQLQQMRFTGSPNLGFQPTSVQSAEIRSDRQVSDLVLVGGEAGGNVNFELSALTLDSFLQSALFAVYKNTHRPTISAIPANNQLTITAGFNSSGILAGTIVRVRLPNATIPIDAMYYVASKATDTVTLTGLLGTEPTILSGSTFTSSEVIVCGSRSAITTDIAIALNTPATGQMTVTFAGTMATNWAIAYPNVALAGHTTHVIGNWIKVFGLTDAIQNFYARLTAVTSTTGVFDMPAGMTNTVGVVGAQVYWGDMLRNPILVTGATPATIGEFAAGTIPGNSYLLERRYEDHSPITREVFTGMAINSFQLTFEPQAILNGQVEFMGFKSNVSNSSPNYADIYTALPTDVTTTTTDVYNTSTNVGQVSISKDNLLSGDVSVALNLPIQVQLNIGNNLRRRNAVGVFGAASMGAGRLSITGNINTYFDSKAILDLIVRNLDAEYTTAVASTDGRGLLFDLPRIKFNGGAPDVPAADQDAVLNPGFVGLRDQTFGYTVHVNRFGFVR